MKTYTEVQVMQVWRCGKCGAERVWGAGDTEVAGDIAIARLLCEGACNGAQQGTGSWWDVAAHSVRSGEKVTEHHFSRSALVQVTETYAGQRGDSKVKFVDFVVPEAAVVVERGGAGGEQ